MNTRREFIRSAAFGAAVATIPHVLRAAPAEAAAKTVPPANAVGKESGLKPLVDWHSHIVTPGELKFLAGRAQAPRVFTDAQGRQLFENVTTVSAVSRGASPTSPSDIAERIRHLDASGVQRQLLTYTVAIGYDATLPIEELRPFYRGLNDELAAIVRAHPDRFLGVAALPTLDPGWAAEELTRAHKELGLIGGALPLNAFSTLEGARTQAPLFAAGQKLGSHFFVHRAPASPKIPGQPPLIVPNDTESVRWNLISNSHLASGAITLGLTDFLDPYPDVSVQIIMLGGFLPYLIDSIAASGPALGIKDPLARLRRIYLEPGPYSGRNASWVSYAAAKFGADRILFGTDYGVGGGAATDRLAPSIASLDEALTAQDRQLIYVDNTRALLKAKGIT
ncbi:MAG TPA: amidohydrolase family protein [Candidatus Didemnitutus sp.]|nr:amidohydrolase family protein [Candidatus Didemnitutus sp.]